MVAGSRRSFLFLFLTRFPDLYGAEKLKDQYLQAGQVSGWSKLQAWLLDPLPSNSARFGYARKGEPPSPSHICPPKQRLSAA